MNSPSKRSHGITWPRLDHANGTHMPFLGVPMAAAHSIREQALAKLPCRSRPRILRLMPCSAEGRGSRRGEEAKCRVIPCAKAGGVAPTPGRRGIRAGGRQCRTADAACMEERRAESRLMAATRRLPLNLDEKCERFCERCKS
jgi:hypothetical protein